MPLPEFLNVDIKASGLKLSLIQINHSLSPIEVDFDNLHSLNNNYILSASRLNFKSVFNFETHVKRISPDTLSFSERIAFQKHVPVKVPLQIKCAQGYAYTKLTITPDTINIYGDTNLIATIDTIYTKPLALTNVKQNVSTNLEFVKPSPNVYMNINAVNVFIEVAHLIEHNLYIPLSNAHSADNQEVHIFPSKVHVRFTSTQNSFRDEDSVLFKATINSEKINPSTKKNFVTLSRIPKNINVLSIEPQEVEVLILKKK